MWKLGIHSVSYGGVWEGQSSLSLEEFIDHAADLGYDGVMLMAKRGHASLLDLTADRRRALREKMESRGLGLAAIAAYNDFTLGAERPDIPLVEMQMLYIKECARLAQDLGGDMVRIFTGYDRTDLSPSQCWARCVRAVKECGKQASEFGVTLAVQNHHDLAVHHDAMFDFLSDVDEPNVGTGWDAWAPALQGLSGEEIKKSVRRVAPFIVQTIVADYVLQPRFHYTPGLTNYAPLQAEARAVAVGEGIIDYPSFFSALCEVGFKGYVTFEMCSALRGGGAIENLDRYASHFRAWMEPFLPK